MWLECHVPISSAFPDSPLICRHRHQNQRRSFKISPFAGSPSWKSPSRPLCARLLTTSEYKLQDICLSSDQLSQSREILLVRHAACFSSNSCWINQSPTFSRQHSCHVTNESNLFENLADAFLLYISPSLWNSLSKFCLHCSNVHPLWEKSGQTMCKIIVANLLSISEMIQLYPKAVQSQFIPHIRRRFRG